MFRGQEDEADRLLEICISLPRSCFTNSDSVL